MLWFQVFLVFHIALCFICGSSIAYTLVETQKLRKIKQRKGYIWNPRKLALLFWKNTGETEIYTIFHEFYYGFGPFILQFLIDREDPEDKRLRRRAKRIKKKQEKARRLERKYFEKDADQGWGIRFDNQNQSNDPRN